MLNYMEKAVSAWEGFKGGNWMNKIDVSDFIKNNYTPYTGDDSFLCEPTFRTLQIWDKVKKLMKLEHDNGGLLDADTSNPSAIDAYAPGDIEKDNEIIVGLQTDAPLKSANIPNGGWEKGENPMKTDKLK